MQRAAGVAGAGGGADEVLEPRAVLRVGGDGMGGGGMGAGGGAQLERGVRGLAQRLGRRVDEMGAQLLVQHQDGGGDGIEGGGEGASAVRAAKRGEAVAQLQGAAEMGQDVGQRALLVRAEAGRALGAVQADGQRAGLAQRDDGAEDIAQAVAAAEIGPEFAAQEFLVGHQHVGAGEDGRGDAAGEGLGEGGGGAVGPEIDMAVVAGIGAHRLVRDPVVAEDLGGLGARGAEHQGERVGAQQAAQLVGGGGPGRLAGGGLVEGFGDGEKAPLGHVLAPAAGGAGSGRIRERCCHMLGKKIVELYRERWRGVRAVGRFPRLGCCSRVWATNDRGLG